MAHPFIFDPGVWIGEGKISFSASPEHVRYYTKWTVEEAKDGVSLCRQEVEIVEGGDPVVNELRFSDQEGKHFIVLLQNEIFGSIPGKGIFDEKTLAWEFREHPEFEGFEVYELQENGDYLLHAEFVSPDQFRTTVEGRIWKKN